MLNKTDGSFWAGKYKTLGIWRNKYQFRALVQSVTFVTVCVSYCVYNYFYLDSNNDNNDKDTAVVTESSSSVRRKTLENCDDLREADPLWLTAFYGVGILYTFLALAIVCDEFFVPALEEMASPRRMNLSMDVAGATLMAAGGSAPELFSSLFGTFKETDIGFGTIIGSAVFNVLFVIAMCSVFAKDVLALTWWPLFRDSAYYAVGIVVLGIFVGVNSKEEIELWEACVLFGLYIGYILLMWKNGDIYRALTGKELQYMDDDDDDDDDDDKNKKGAGEQKEGDDTLTPSSNNQNGSLDPETAQKGGGIFQLMSHHQGNWPGTFRAGVLKLMRDPGNWIELGGVGIVASLVGDADSVFQQIDSNRDGFIDESELHVLFDTLELNMSDAELKDVFKQLDQNKDGVISNEEFHHWYTNSKEYIRSQVRIVFDKLDKNKSNKLEKHDIKALLEELDANVTDEDVQQAVDNMYRHGSRDEITFEEFEEWYEHSILFERRKKKMEQDAEGVWDNLTPPYGEGFLSWFQYLLVFPLVLALALTIPDVRRPGWSKFCYLSFLLSIAWIGGFSYFMVDWAEIIGNTIGIPSVVMGLTVLAAGTSVPDLLSSVIVARRGSGDMAVSSSIGSNIFDILVGLPVPWIIFTAFPSKPDVVAIESDNIFFQLCLLLLMLVLVIASIHCQGWKLSKGLGGIMMVLYLAFLCVSVALELPFETCIET